MIGKGGGVGILTGRTITGNTSIVASGVERVCSAVIGQELKPSILQGGLIRGIHTLTAGTKVTVRVYKLDGINWRKVDEYDVTKDGGLEVNIGQVAHNGYMKISVEHDDVGETRTFGYVFIVQDMVE